MGWCSFFVQNKSAQKIFHSSLRTRNEDKQPTATENIEIFHTVIQHVPSTNPTIKHFTDNTKNPLKDFSSPKRPDVLWCPASPLFSGQRRLQLEVKPTGHEAGH
jgi:hypothetical protein